MGNINNTFFNNLDAAATWSAGVAFKRSKALPLDRYSVFSSKAAAIDYAEKKGAYAETPVSYPGQIIAVTENNTMVAYVLTENAAGDKLTLKQIGIIPTGDDASISVDGTGLITLFGFGGAENNRLPMKIDGKIVWKSLEDIGAGDGNDNTTYSFAVCDHGKGIVITPSFNGQPIKDEETGATVTYHLDLDVYTTAESEKRFVAKDKLKSYIVGTAELAPEDQINHEHRMPLHTVATNGASIHEDLPLVWFDDFTIQIKAEDVSIDLSKQYFILDESNDTVCLDFYPAGATLPSHECMLIQTGAQDLLLDHTQPPRQIVAALNAALAAAGKNKTYDANNAEDLKAIELILTCHVIQEGLGIEEGAQVNKIETIKVNDTALEIDAQKAINISVPTSVNDFDDYIAPSTYTVVKGTSTDSSVAAVYHLYQDGAPIGDPIKIPSDLVVSDGYIEQTYGYRKYLGNNIFQVSDTDTRTHTAGIGDWVYFKGAYVDTAPLIYTADGWVLVTDQETILTQSYVDNYLATNKDYVLAVEDGPYDITFLVLVLSDKDNTKVKIPVNDLVDVYTGSEGIKVENYVVKHTNSITAKTNYELKTQSLTHGGTFDIVEEKYDANGHITGKQKVTYTLPAATDISGKKDKQTAVANKITATNHVLSSLTQDENGNISYGVRALTPANIGAKATQTAVTDPTANGSALEFISNITQNEQGVIAPVKKSVNLSDYAKKTELPVVNNGKFTVSGTGALEGSGSMTANQLGDSTATLDLTQATKNTINNAVQTITSLDTSADHTHGDEINCGGLKATKTGSTVNIEIDDSITFILNCGSAADL